VQLEDPTMAVTLSATNLPKLPVEVARPKYARADIKPGIVHFGVGNFHRAHQAVYLDELFSAGRSRDFGILGAGVLSFDAAARDRMAAQDFLTTVVEQDENGMSARVTAPMLGFLDPADRAGMVEALADPAIRIVSLTITEGGYFLDAAGRFNPDHPDIRHDAKNPDSPNTVFGIMLAALRRRRANDAEPFSVMCCDNIPGNGHVTENVVTGLAALCDRDFAAWIEGEVAFPNSMVDRITPATTDRERGILAEKFGIEDNWPVFCEPFRQWVMEDRFPTGRPALEEVGVTFVSDVAPFELMKIRILNGGHAAIAYPAALMDIHFVHEAMQEPLIRDYLRKLHDDEIVPTVPPVPGTDLPDYRALIERRFANPRIGDTIRRLCLDGSNRQPKFIVPTIAASLGKGGPVAGLALVSALWCRYCEGTTDSGKVTEPNDPNWSRLTETAKQARSNPAAWLAMREVYGDVGRDARFAGAFADALATLWQVGAREALKRYVAGTL
jgi:mannitol 2-dehydrogenase